MAAIISCHYCTSPSTTNIFKPTKPFRFPNASSHVYLRRFGTRCSTNNQHPFDLQNKQVEFFFFGSGFHANCEIYVLFFFICIVALHSFTTSYSWDWSRRYLHVHQDLHKHEKSTQLKPVFIPTARRKDCNFSVKLWMDLHIKGHAHLRNCTLWLPWYDLLAFVSILNSELRKSFLNV